MPETNKSSARATLITDRPATCDGKIESGDWLAANPVDGDGPVDGVAMTEVGVLVDGALGAGDGVDAHAATNAAHNNEIETALFIAPY